MATTQAQSLGLRFAVALVAVAGTAGLAAADSETRVNSFYGAFGTEVPIELPPFRSLQPQVKLSYSSTSSNGFVGVGWTLAAGSYIDRVSPGKGTPSHTANDIYVLDGQELVPHTGLGGTHATKIQSYLRIKQNPGANEWYVWRKDGTKATYRPLFESARGTLRWGLSTLVDTHDNTVSFGYWCDVGPWGAQDCYLDNIRYNGASVVFYREKRPDAETFAIGERLLGKTSYRLKTIDVKVGDERARAYKLTYTVSGSTGRSLLASVTQYGRDATLDSSGTVTGGNKLPPMTMSSTHIGTMIAPVVQSRPNGTFDWEACGNRIVQGDFTGDGNEDIACGYGEGGDSTLYIFPGGRSGYFKHQAYYTGVRSWNRCSGGPLVGDYNGDGFDDIACAYVGQESDGLYVYWGGTPDPFFYGTSSNLLGKDASWAGPGTPQSFAWARCEHRLLVGDFDSDGQDEIACGYDGNGDDDGLYVFPGDWSYSHGYARPDNRLAGDFDWDACGDRVFTADFEGDGVADIACGYDFGNAKYALYIFPGGGGDYYAHSGPSGTNSFNWQSCADRVLVGDYNGDGKADIACGYDYGDAKYALYIFPGGGAGYYAHSGPSGTNAFNWSSCGDRVLVGDYNGDGKHDIACGYDYGDGKYALFVFYGGSRGPYAHSGPSGTHVFNWGSCGDRVRVGDFNGDGKHDIACGYVMGNGTSTLAVFYGGSSGYDTRWSSVAFNVDWGGCGDRLLVGDFRKRGVDELACGYDSSDITMLTFRSTGAKPDLLRRVDNGIGGRTVVSYRAETVQPEPAQRTLIFAVASLTTFDGRGDSATTSYQYEGGLWSALERRFLGFRKVTAVIDAAGNYTETYYHQHVGCTSKPEATYFRNAAGGIHSFARYEYQESESAPYTSLLTDRWDYRCEGATWEPACQRTLTQLGYDVYGNVIEAREHGNYDATGDERTTITSFFPNTSAYIVGKRRHENVYEGIGTEGRLVRRETLAYNSRGDLSWRSDWRDSDGASLFEQFGYDQWGNVVWESNALNEKKTTSYDTTYHLYPTFVCDAEDHCRSTEYDYVLGVPTKETDSNGRVATRTYDPQGRITRFERPDGSWDAKHYASWGNPWLQKIRTVRSDGSAEGLWTDEYFDGKQRTYKRVTKGGGTQHIEYFEGSDRVWKQSLWYQPGAETPRYVVRAYDGVGRVTRVTAPDGTFATTDYRICRNYSDPDFAAPRSCVTHTDELGHSTREAHDGFGRVVNRSEWWYAGEAADRWTESRTRYEYDALGRQVRVTDGDGHVRTNTFDSLGNLIAACDPDMGCWAYGYDAVGRRISATDAKGQTTHMAYDAVGRRVSETAADGAEVAWIYDEEGHGDGIGDQPTTVTWSGGSDSLHYDATGRVIESTRCVLDQCERISWRYDRAGRLSGVTYPSGEEVTYSYDAVGRLSSVPGYVTDMQYNGRGQLVQIDFANGTSQRYSYDDRRAWLSSASVTGPGGTLYQASYGYDAAARVTSIDSTTDAHLNVNFTYDDLNRLTGVSGAQSRTIGYYKLGRITGKSDIGSYSYAAEHPHAVASAGSATYSYDANGNMTAGAGRTLQWDAKNRLASVTKAGLTTSFGYDPDGQRTYKAAGGAVSRFYGKLAERGADGTRTSYVYAGPLLIAKTTGVTRSYYHSDHAGSVQLVTDFSGEAARRYDYAPFGATSYDSGGVANARGFGGHDTDPETGLIYMNARYFDAQLGRFISPDTIIPDRDNPQALDRYSFAYNNPISNVDPTGHAPVAVALVAVASAVVTSAPPLIIAVAAVGAAATVAGYVLEDPTLMTIGAVALGFSTGYAGPLLGGGLAGGVLGATVAAASSPLSPLDPGVKRAVGWVYAAAGFVAAQLKASATLEQQRLAAMKQADVEGLTLAEVQTMGFGDPQRAIQSAYTIAKDAPGYTIRHVLEVSAAMDGGLGLGMVGPGNGWVTKILDNTIGRIPSVRLHGVVHDAFGLAYSAWKVGPGYGYGGNLFNLGKGWPLTGQLEGVIRGAWGGFGTVIDDMSLSVGAELGWKGQWLGLGVS